MPLFLWFARILLITITCVGVRMAAQEPAKTDPAKPAAPLQPMPKFRQWNALESSQVEILNLRSELLKRVACESIDVKYDDCNFANGFVSEKPKTPAAATPAPAKVEEKK